VSDEKKIDEFLSGLELFGRRVDSWHNETEIRIDLGEMKWDDPEVIANHLRVTKACAAAARSLQGVFPSDDLAATIACYDESIARLELLAESSEATR
jgi:hypothetical protein